MPWKKIAAGTAATLMAGTGGTFAADEAINPYDDTGAKLEITAESVTPDAGAVKAELSKREPAVTLSKWNGEAAMTVKYENVKAEGARAFLTDRMEWNGGKEDVHAYPLEAKAGMEDGGFEIEVILKEKPDTNVFSFQIEGAEDLDFFYQPPLWEQAGLPAATPNCTDTNCVLIDGATYRPENVVGSYAVYSSLKANHVLGSLNYSTGKLFHIFRPRVSDASGRTVWALLSYKGGILNVTVPQSFLDTADYPVTVDPTFGKTDIGASDSTSPNSNRKDTMLHTLTEAGSVTKISWYLAPANVGNATVKAILYDSTPSSLLSTQGATTSMSGNTIWVDIPFASPVVLSSGNYHIGLHSSSIFTAKSDAAGTNCLNTDNFADGTSNPFGTCTSSANQKSAYATYTASAVPATDDTYFEMLGN